MKKVNKQKYNKIYILFAVFLAAISIYIGWDAYVKMHKTGLPDLRGRIVGLRVMLEGKNPYTYTWIPGDPEEYIDPLVRPHEGISRVTVPPSVLLLHSPLSNLDYVSSMRVWFWVQYVFLVFCIYLGCKLVAIKFRLEYIILTLALAGSTIWITHLRSGQLYIVYVFLLLLVWYLHSRQKIWASSFLIALVVVLRPFYVLFLVTLFFFSRRYFFKVVVNIATIGVLVGVFVGFNQWYNYLDAIYIHASLPIKSVRYISVLEYYPSVVEGFNLDGMTVNITAQVSNVRDVVNNIGLRITNEGVLFILLIFLGMFFLSARVRKYIGHSFEQALLSALLLTLISEILVPVPRYQYYDIQLLGLAALIITIYKKQKSISQLVLGYALMLVNAYIHNPTIGTFLIWSLMLILTSTIYMPQVVKNMNKIHDE